MVGHYQDCPESLAECWCEVRRLSRVLGITIAILFLEIIGGWLSGSLALFADAGHVLSDSAAIVVTLITAVIIKIGARTRRVRDAAFRINIGLLFLIASWIMLESIERLQNPSEILSPVLVAFATLGGIGNYLQHRILESAAEEHKHHAHRVLSFHIISDMAQSGAVVVGGVAIWISGWVIIDPLLSIGIAVWIARQAVKLALDS